MHAGKGAHSKFKTVTAPVVQRELVIRRTVNTAVIIIIFKSLTDNYCHIITYRKSFQSWDIRGGNK